MKKLISILLLCFCFSATAQNKEVIINLNHKYGGANFNFDSTYVVDGFTPIKFDRLEYYLHIKSLGNDNEETITLTDNYILVSPSENHYNIGTYEISDVSTLLLYIGVAPETNHNDPSIWPLSHPLTYQIPSMHWGLSNGYIFVALEGMIDKNQDGILETVTQYHPVGDNYYSGINLTDAMIETDSTIQLFVDVNYDKLIENLGTSEGGIFQGFHEENQLLINNFIYNNVFSVDYGLISGTDYIEDNVEETNVILDQLNQSFDAWNISIDLSSGWNMFGYGCPSSIDVADGLSNHTESIIITKDNNGNVYMPEFGFNGIGDFTPGFGYQIKLTEAIEGFSLCDWYVNDIPEDNIVSLQDSLQLINSQIGCTDTLACNYDINKLYEDGTCQYPDDYHDCNGNQLPQYQLGDFAQGGIVFYVDETGQHGLVSALEDLGQFEWGCLYQVVNGADGTSIGTGYQNTMDIINQGCSTENGGITAAQAALDTEINGYSDWYLPSQDELLEMYNTIGNGGLEGNIGGFETNDSFKYWSSSEFNSDYAWYVSFSNGSAFYIFLNKDNTYRVRPIRAFGNWTMGCMDLEACNFNPEANMADGSCEFAELGYDCNGNITAEIGDVMEGGYLFYIDETGQHGLVAAMEDIDGTYEWGCWGDDLNGADGTAIGTGYQNTLDIINANCLLGGHSITAYYEGINAAEAASNFESEGYNDWYLPSKDELLEMYYTIGNGGLEGNIGGFIVNTSDGPYYWSSSEDDISYAWLVALDYVSTDVGTGLNDKFANYRVRVIRSF